jgi:hypothetical protein
MYFNLPLNFFRSIDRHYMPSFVIFAVLMAIGTAMIIQQAKRVKRPYRTAAIAIILILLTLLPIQAIWRNYRNIDGSKSYFAYDTAENYLSNLPPDAIFFAQSDIDTYTLWCLQVAEKFRPDVTVCNLSLMNTTWFVEQVQKRDEKFPIKFGQGELSSLSIIPWQDTTIAIPVRGNPVEFGLPPDTLVPDTIRFEVLPSLSGQYILVQDQMILKILKENNWRRPVCFSMLIPETAVQWLKPYLRLEGVYWRIVPARFESLERNLLRSALIERLNYRGFSDTRITKEPPTKWIGWNLYHAFLTLSSMEYDLGDTLACRNTIDKMTSLLPPEELSPPPELAAATENACK